jgi:hypothetical protein
MGKRLECRKRKRRGLKVKIYELKKFVDNEMNNATSEDGAKQLYNVLEHMCDLFDIPRIEEFLSGGDYHEVKINSIEKEETTHTPESAKAMLRKMFNMD